MANNVKELADDGHMASKRPFQPKMRSLLTPEATILIVTDVPIILENIKEKECSYNGHKKN